MKIAIIGYSGSGKSTLSGKLAEKYGIDVMHLDSVNFLPNWQERPLNESVDIVNRFMDAHDSWVIEGNYSRFEHERRMREADQIIFFQFNRFACLFRVIRRYRTFKYKTRPDMAPGCNEKLDWDFVKWILVKGRTKKRRERFEDIAKRYPEKFTRIRFQRELTRFEKKHGLSAKYDGKKR